MTIGFWIFASEYDIYQEPVMLLVTIVQGKGCVMTVREPSELLAMKPLVLLCCIVQPADVLLIFH